MNKKELTNKIELTNEEYIRLKYDIRDKLMKYISEYPNSDPNDYNSRLYRGILRKFGEPENRINPLIEQAKNSRKLKR